jgi:rhamnose transport system ATP-binding protein
MLVMRDGRTIGTYLIEELLVRKVVELMAGGILTETKHERKIDRRPSHGSNLSTSGEREYHDVNVVVRPGEVVGLYGLVGSGVLEIADSRLRHRSR